MPKRIQRMRVKGWRMPPNTVSVTRPGRWGNPAKVGAWKGFTAEDAVDAFRAWLRQDPGYRTWTGFYGKRPTYEEIRTELRGKDLACWCSLNQPCHADVLLKIANTEENDA